eukprot:750097-Hanusia_phi.AAC.2
MEEEQWQFQNAKAAAIVIQRLWRGQNPSVKLRSFALQRHKVDARYRKWRERVYGEKCWNYLKPGEQPDNGEEAELRKTQSKLDQIESMTNSYVAEQARLREESVQKLQRVQNYLEFMQTTVSRFAEALELICAQEAEPAWLNVRATARVSQGCEHSDDRRAEAHRTYKDCAVGRVEQGAQGAEDSTSHRSNALCLREPCTADSLLSGVLCDSGTDSCDRAKIGAAGWCHNAEQEAAGKNSMTMHEGLTRSTRRRQEAWRVTLTLLR